MSWAKAFSYQTTHLCQSSPQSLKSLGTKPALIKANNFSAWCIESGAHYYPRLRVKFLLDLSVGGISLKSYLE